jgi:hypothetical protein
MAAKKTTAKRASKGATKRAGGNGGGRGPKPLKNLIIAADDGKLYELAEKDYKKKEFVIAEQDAGPIRQSLKWGTTLAFIPPSVGVGIGSICYLVNLASLRIDHPWGEK